jgi:hypothetical protein
MERNRLLGICLERGDILPKALEKTSKSLDSDFIDVSGFGELQWVEISNQDEGGRPIRFEGPLNLINLNGRIRRAGAMVISDFVCTLSRQTDNGISVIGGKLIAASVIHLEVTMSPLMVPDSVQPAKSDITKVKSDIINAPPPIMSRTIEEEAEVSSPPISKRREKDAVLDERWAKAIAETKAFEGKDAYADDEADIRPRLGDKVNHRQFGECTVSRIDDDHITLRKPDGRNVQLGLQILVFTRVGHKEGKDVFDVQVGSRR